MSNFTELSKDSVEFDNTKTGKRNKAKAKKAPTPPKVATDADDPRFSPAAAASYPAAPRLEDYIAARAVEPPRAPMPNDTFRPEPPNLGAYFPNCAEQQCPVLFRELVERFCLLRDKLNSEKIDDFDLPDIARGLEALVSSTNFFAKVYIGGIHLLVPVPEFDSDALNFAAPTLYQQCRVIAASIDAALHELANLLDLGRVLYNAPPKSNDSDMEEVPF